MLRTQGLTKLRDHLLISNSSQTGEQHAVYLLQSFSKRSHSCRAGQVLNSGRKQRSSVPAGVTSHSETSQMLIMAIEVKQPWFGGGGGGGGSTWHRRPRHAHLVVQSRPTGYAESRSPLSSPDPRPERQLNTCQWKKLHSLKNAGKSNVELARLSHQMMMCLRHDQQHAPYGPCDDPLPWECMQGSLPSVCCEIRGKSGNLGSRCVPPVCKQSMMPGMCLYMLCNIIAYAAAMSRNSLLQPSDM